MMPDVIFLSDHDIIREASQAAMANGFPPLVLKWLALRREHGPSMAAVFVALLYGPDVGHIIGARVHRSIDRRLVTGWTYRLVPPRREERT